MCGSKLTWLLSGGPKRLGFSVVIETDLVIVRRLEFTCCCMRAENDLCSARSSIDLVFVWVVEMDLVLVCDPKMTWF